MSQEKLHIITHPLVQHKISMLRDKNTSSKEFRELVSETAMLMTYEATRDLPLKEVEIETPVATARTKFISGHKMAFVPLMRAGLGMLDGVLELVPAAKVGHIGVYRNPDTHQPVEYYCKLPDDIKQRSVIVVDPMLATGGSACAALTKLKERDIRNIKFMCIIASQPGLDFLMKHHPDVEIYCGAVDPELDENLYIVPGMGDAGDRIFGTK